MEKIPQTTSPEIVFGSSDPQESRAIARQVRAGKLRKIAGRVYSSNLEDAPEAIVRRNVYLILGRLFPVSVLSHRTALEGGVATDNSIFLSYKYTKKVQLPGVTVRLLKGHGPVEGDTPFMEGLYIASRARALLENMQPARAREGVPKSWSSREIEDFLDNICRVHGEKALNALRDQARNLSKILEMEKEYQALDKLIGAILGTQKGRRLVSEAARARAKGLPYDAHRLELFTTLYGALKRAVLPVRPAPEDTPEAIRNLTFFEAYFSNYIEGTEFLVEEAADIIFRNKPMPHRPADAHDILSTFQIVSNTQEMNRIPSSAEELLDLLKSRHAALMSARPETAPGRFKEEINRAGETVFVAPELVRGTLIKGFEVNQSLEDPLSRAMFMMFLVAEVHPFADGNGRIARIMMNAELVHGKLCRVLIPTVYREDYLLALRALSRQGNPEPYVRMLDRAQEFTSRINFSKYDQTLVQLRASGAFAEPYERKLMMPSEE